MAENHVFDEKEGNINIFKEKWEDSDVTFIIEGVTFHAHRTLLGLVSPVFKAMFSSDFKEKKLKKVPLPRKNARSFLHFLLSLYSRDVGEMSVEDTCELLKLGDEYQVSRVVRESRQFLLHASLTDEQAVQVLLLAQQYGFDDLRRKCCALLKTVKACDLKWLEGFHDLDGTSMKNILLPQLEESQACLKEVLPQMIGLMEFVVYLVSRRTSDFKLCPEHYDGGGKAKRSSTYRMQHCPVCKAMFDRVHKEGYKISTNYLGEGKKRVLYGFDYSFDEGVVPVVCRTLQLAGK